MQVLIILIDFPFGNLKLKGCFTVGHHFLIEKLLRTNSLQLNTFLGSPFLMDVLLWEILFQWTSFLGHWNFQSISYARHWQNP